MNVNVLANFQAFWMQSLVIYFVCLFFLFVGWLDHTHKINRAGWRFLSPPNDLDTLFHHDGLVCVAEEPGLCDGSCESGRFYLSVCCLFVRLLCFPAVPVPGPARVNSFALLSLVSKTRISVLSRRGCFAVWVFCVWGWVIAGKPSTSSFPKRLI